MGIQAPTSYDKFISIQSALLSYNRPLILAGIFILSFLIALFLSKRNILLSLLASVGIVLAVAIYYVVTFVSAIRY